MLGAWLHLSVKLSFTNIRGQCHICTTLVLVHKGKFEMWKKSLDLNHVLHVIAKLTSMFT